MPVMVTGCRRYNPLTFRPISLRSRQRECEDRELADGASQHRRDAEMEEEPVTAYVTG